MLFIVLTSKLHGIDGSDNADEEGDEEGDDKGGDDKGGDDKEGIPPNQQEDETEEDMQIFVKFCFDPHKTITLEVDSDDTIGTIKKYIKNKESIPRNDQRLLFKGGDLADGKTLSDYKIKTQATLYLHMRGKGGGPKGKKLTVKKDSRVAILKAKSEPLMMKVQGLDMNGLTLAVNKCGMQAETMLDGTHDSLVFTIANKATMEQVDQLIELNSSGTRPAQLIKEVAPILFPHMKVLGDQVEVLLSLEKVVLEGLELYFTKDCYNEQTEKYEFGVLKDAAVARKTNLTDISKKTMELQMAEMRNRLMQMEVALRNATSNGSVDDADMSLM